MLKKKPPPPAPSAVVLANPNMVGVESKGDSEVHMTSVTVESNSHYSSSSTSMSSSSSMTELDANGVPIKKRPVFGENPGIPPPPPGQKPKKRPVYGEDPNIPPPPPGKKPSHGEVASPIAVEGVPSELMEEALQDKEKALEILKSILGEKRVRRILRDVKAEQTADSPPPPPPPGGPLALANEEGLESTREYLKNRSYNVGETVEAPKSDIEGMFKVSGKGGGGGCRGRSTVCSPRSPGRNSALLCSALLCSVLS